VAVKRINARPAYFESCFRWVKPELVAKVRYLAGASTFATDREGIQPLTCLRGRLQGIDPPLYISP
jgi:hypothetical protein